MAVVNRRIGITYSYAENHLIRNRACRSVVCVSHGAFDGRRLYGDIAFDGVSCRVHRAYAALIQTELVGVCAFVFGDLHTYLHFHLLEILGFAALYYVLWAAPAYERITAQIQNQPLACVWYQSALV